MTLTDLKAIHVDITFKEGSHWLISGSCPEWVAESGYLHVYRGAKAMVLDGVSDQVIARGNSLRAVLQRLADKTGLSVIVDDEEDGTANCRIEPSQSTPAK